jgi:catalase
MAFAGNLAQESPPPDEAAFARSIADRLRAKIIRDNPTGIIRRDAHPKMHGVVRAEFIVEPDLPEDLRIGIFREPKTYPAWIRFSNQSNRISPDSKRDIRGMAIKLMGVPGEKLLDEERDEQTQDFILISTPVFVTKDVREFDGLLKAMESGILAQLWFYLTHWRMTRNVLGSLKRFGNPLRIRYFSTTPYLWGETAVKYSAIPRAGATDAIPKPAEDDFLRAAMVRQLEAGDARFDFAVQLRTNAGSMPIEDPGKAWSEAASPYRKVASIVIPRQSFDGERQREFGENLSFTPWHSLPEHRPLGGVNRARKLVYAAISTFRHEKNNAPRREPASWEI